MTHVASPTTDVAVVRDGAAWLVFVTIATLGACAAIAQLALLRELMGAFSGNELTFGVALATWLVLTAAGTWLGRHSHATRHPLRWLTLGVAIASLLPVAEVLAIRGFRDVVFARGVAADPIAATLACLVVLAPFCLTSGALLIHGCRTLAWMGQSISAGRIYAADAIGSIVGAAIFAFVLANRLDHVASVGWAAAVAFGIAAAICLRRRARPAALGCLAVAALMGAVALRGNLDGISTGWQHRGRDIVWRSSSPYGRLAVTQSAGQLTFFNNGVPVAFSADAIAAEEIVHYALAQRPEATSILLIGGAVTGVAREILRYPAVRIATCIELDPQMIAAGERLLPGRLSDPRLRVVVDDGRRFVQHTRELFDIIIVALPDPTTFQLNRFFTAEFYAEAQRVLKPSGVIAFGLGHYENYVSPELAQLLGSSRRTLATAFANTTAVPGGRVFLLASQAPLHRDMAAAIERAGVTPQWVNRDYLDATLTADRLADIDRALLTPAPINTDFRPTLYLIRLRQWLRQFAFPAAGFGLALALGASACLVRFAAVPRLIFASGFAASALEVAALVAIQVFYGSMYQQIGVVMAVFMAGLAAGSIAGNALRRKLGRRAVRGIGVVVAVLAVGFSLVLPAVGTFDRWCGLASGGQAVVLLLTLLLAVLVGAQFALAAAEASPTDSRSAPRLFSADLAGAALGAIIVSTYLLPMWGLTVVCWTTAGLNLLAAALASWSPRYP